MKKSNNTTSDTHQTQRSLVNRILGNATWLTASRLISDLSGLLLFVFISRHYGPIGVGQYAYSFAISGIIYASVNLGLEDYAIREYTRLNKKHRHILLGNIILLQIIALFCVLVGLSLYMYFVPPSPDTFNMIVFLTIFQILISFSRMLFVPAFSQEKIHAPTLAELLCRVSPAFISILLIEIANIPLSVALISYPVAGVVLLIFAILLAYRFSLSIKLSLPQINFYRIIQDAWPFSASLIIYYAYSRIGIILLSAISGEEDAGIYATALKFIEVGTMPLFFVGFAAYPILTRYFNTDNTSFGKVSDTLLRTCLLLGGIFAWVLYFLGPYIATTVLTTEFSQVTPILQSIAIMGLLLAIEVTAVRLLWVMNKHFVRLKIQFIGTVIYVLLNLALIPNFGLFGAVISTIVALTIKQIWYFLYLSTIPKTKLILKPFIQFVPLLLSAILPAIATAILQSQNWVTALVSLFSFITASLMLRFIPLDSLKRTSKIPL